MQVRFLTQIFALSPISLGCLAFGINKLADTICFAIPHLTCVLSSIDSQGSLFARYGFSMRIV